MKIHAVKQDQAGETRCVLTPSVIKKLIAPGIEVAVERGLGEASMISDDQFEQGGATLIDQQSAWSDADVLITLNPPSPENIDKVKQGAVIIGMLSALTDRKLVEKLQTKGVTAFALELLPRISRAQSMDVLSSQANIGGYKAALLAAEHCPKMFPMMITAAGTLSPAKVFVLGAGVAGLQAIATAKRLGAIVEAFDVRAATKEQIQSLGARFVELPGAAQNDKATGGYAKQQTDEEQKQQAQLMAKHVTGADASICTAAVPGKAPPMLIPADVVAKCKPASVIVDLAASAEHGRGNCELTRPGQVYTTDNRVTIVGTMNLPGLLPVHASQVYANNIASFLGELIDTPKEGDASLALKLEDELQQGCCVTHDGELVSPRVKDAYAPAAEPANDQPSETPSE